MIEVDMNVPDTVWLIGGGPSFKRIIDSPLFERLRSKSSVFTTNNAWKLFPDRIGGLFADWMWYQWWENEIDLNKPWFTTSFYRGVETKRRDNETLWAAKGVNFLTRERGIQGLTTVQNSVCGNNSGHQAINLLLNMGAKTIYLLGFDSDPDRPGNWHSEHKRVGCGEAYRCTFLPGFRAVAADLPLKYPGRTIINLNPGSAITFFEFKRLEDAL